MASLTLPVESCRDRALKSLATLPPFSPVLNRLLATLSSDNVSIRIVAEIVEKDLVIAGNVLKLVNSAMYGRRGVVTSVTHAATLLGIYRLRNVVLGMSVSRLWNQVKTPPGWSSVRFNLHSVAVALLSDLLAQRINVEFAEGAFLAGLFHDLGKLLIAIGLRDEYAQIRTAYEQNNDQLLMCEKEVLDIDHAELSYQALMRWRMPEPICIAVRDHHLTNPGFGLQPGTQRLYSVVRCADAYVLASGISVESERSLADVAEADPLALLGIDAQIPEVLEEFHAEYAALSAFFR